MRAFAVARPFTSAWVKNSGLVLAAKIGFMSGRILLFPRDFQ